MTVFLAIILTGIITGGFVFLFKENSRLTGALTEAQEEAHQMFEHAVEAEKRKLALYQDLEFLRQNFEALTKRQVIATLTDDQVGGIISGLGSFIVATYGRDKIN